VDEPSIVERARDDHHRALWGLRQHYQGNGGVHGLVLGFSRTATDFEDSVTRLADTLGRQRSRRAERAPLTSRSVPRRSRTVRSSATTIVCARAGWRENAAVRFISSDCSVTAASTRSATPPPWSMEATGPFAEGGLSGLIWSPECGGKGMPHAVGVPTKEMIDAANLAWRNFPLLSHGATEALLRRLGAEEGPA